VRLLRNEKARGFGMASDQALRAVRTQLALLVDADITFLPGDFAAALAAFRAEARLGWSNFQQVSAEGKPGASSEVLIAPAWVYALGNAAVGRWERGRMRSYRPEMLGERIAAVPVAHSSSALVRMEAFREVDGFDARFWQCQADNDFCLRLARAGWKVGVDQVYTVRHDGIGGKTGGAARVWDLYRGKLLFYETHRPGCRVYLRPMLAARHLAEAGVAALRRGPRAEHVRAAFRLRLAAGVWRGYAVER
jgi:GT2 family glycosyltransferase